MIELKTLIEQLNNRTYEFADLEVTEELVTTQDVSDCYLETDPPDIHSLIEAIVKFDQLEKLILDGVCIPLDSQKLFKEFLKTNKNLISLKMQQVDYDTIKTVGEALHDNRYLTSLEISWHDPIKEIEALIKGLKHNKTLKELFLVGFINEGPEEDLTYNFNNIATLLKYNQTLTSFRLQNNSLKIKDLKTFFDDLRLNTSLEILDLEHCIFEPGMAMHLTKALSQHPNLHSLYFRESNLSAKDLSVMIPHLAKLPKLTTLSLSRACTVYATDEDDDIADDILSLISKYFLAENKLKSLNVCQNEFNRNGREGCNAFLKWVGNNTSLTELNLDSTFLAPENLAIFAASLEKNHQLTKLDLPCLNLTSELAATAVARIINYQVLRNLNLSHSTHSDEGLEIIEKALKENHQLHTLSIGTLDLRFSHLQMMMNVIKTHSSIKELSMQGTSLLETGKVECVSEMLTRNCNITSLNLSGCHIYVKQSKTLVEALQQNKSLCSLDLRETKLHGCQEDIMKLLRENENLTELLVDNDCLHSNARKRRDAQNEDVSFFLKKRKRYREKQLLELRQEMSKYIVSGPLIQIVANFLEKDVDLISNLYHKNPLVLFSQPALMKTSPQDAASSQATGILPIAYLFERKEILEEECNVGSKIASSSCSIM